MFKIKLGGGKTAEVEEKLYWHTTSHIMAQAVKRLFPNAKVTIGPAIDNGFYYDFDVDKAFSEDDLKNIEEEMKKIADFITLAIRDFDANADKIREGVAEICKKFPLYK